jgi:signal recognition particle receptor subunit alpha
MIDFFVIVSQGGTVIWSYQYDHHVHGGLVNQFLQAVFLEGQGSNGSLLIETLQFHWTQDNSTQCVYIAAYQKMFHVTYADELVKKSKDELGGLLQKNSASLQNATGHLSKGDVNIGLGPMPLNPGSEGYERITKKFTGILNEIEQSQGSNRPNSTGGSKGTMMSIMEQLKVTDSGSGEKTGTPPTKAKRTWAGKISKDDAAKLDFGGEDSKESLESSGTEKDRNAVDLIPTHMPLDGEMPEVENQDSKITKANSWVSSMFKTLSGKKDLTKESLQEPLGAMKEHLIHKNVAANIADQIVCSVESSLEGETIQMFSSLASRVQEGTENAIRQILTPKGHVDLIQEIVDKKSQKPGTPYTIAFIGVNGVGKSTNLSKVCFWILQKRFKVLIAACDTFRSGAVEQLRVHVKNLSQLKTGKVDLFERGYGKDAAGIAKDAIQYAKGNEYDVVLIDTAGRMQDNEPLMRALAKLVSVNQPDKIIFVGEALVGNEAVDQLTKFNRALIDFAPPEATNTASNSDLRLRKIDAIILTKFDTIDDKVGAALSMSHVSGAPILFVGTGQTYMDLKRMNVQAVVNMLLSSPN